MNEPNLLMREIRAHERLIESDGATWPPELRRLAHRKLLALKMMDQPEPEAMKRENDRDIAAFNDALTAFLARQGT